MKIKMGTIELQDKYSKPSTFNRPITVIEQGEASVEGLFLPFNLKNLNLLKFTYIR
jgi:hypothetical protein